MRHIAKERVIKTLIISSIFLLLLQSCKPQPVETQFNALITPPSGDDQEYITMEDQPIEVSYTPIGNDNSIELWSKIAKRPSNGQLEKCQEGEGGKVTCMYVPNKNFNGKDSVMISQGDGKLISDKTPVLEIKVLPVNDAPVANNYKDGTSHSEDIIFDFLVPLANDPDSPAQDLEYKIISGDLSAVVEEKCFVSKGDRRCAVSVPKEFDNEYQFKYQVTDQEGLVSNEAQIILDFSRKINKGEANFSQSEAKEAKGVDIVWVVDNSGSMSNDQENLRSNFQSFIQNFLSDGKARFDFKMGVATTDEYSYKGDGKLESDSSGNRYVLTATKAEADFTSFKNDFEKAVMVGTDGSGKEQALRSFDTILANEGSWFGGDERLLVAIILSDEREQSISKTPEEWANHLKALKKDPSMVKVYPIVEIEADAEERYKKIAEATGGLRYDIRKPFDGVLNSISESVATQLLSKFQINSKHEVVSGTLKVLVNGVPSQPGIDYVLEENRIVFTVAPAAGAEITVRYDYKWK